MDSKLINKKLQQGFTLIELLVVVAIIGVLSSVVLSSLNNARVKARDTKRIADLVQIRVALEMYYSDNGYYPPSSCGWDCNNYSVSTVSSDWSALQAHLSPYMKNLPVDPINNCGGAGPWNPGCYVYSYGNVGRTTYPAQYDLTAGLEDANNPYRCGVKGYRFYFNDSYPWCTAFGGSYTNQVYEAS